MGITLDALKKLQQEGAFASEGSKPTDPTGPLPQGDVADSTGDPPADDSVPSEVSASADCVSEDEVADLVVEINEASSVVMEHIEDIAAEDIAELELLAQSGPEPILIDSPEVELDMADGLSPLDAQNDETCEETCEETCDETVEEAVEEAWDELAALAQTKSLEAEAREHLSCDEADTDPKRSLMHFEDTTVPSDAEAQETTPEVPADPPPVSPSDEVWPSPDEHPDHESESKSDGDDATIRWPDDSEPVVWDEPPHSIPATDEAPDASHYAPVIPSVDELLDDLQDFELDPGLANVEPTELTESVGPANPEAGMDDLEGSIEPTDKPADPTGATDTQYELAPEAIPEANDVAEMEDMPSTSGDAETADTMALEERLRRVDSDVHQLDPQPVQEVDGHTPPAPVASELRMTEQILDESCAPVAEAPAASVGFDQHVLHLYSSPECREAIKQFIGNVRLQCADKIPGTLLLASIAGNRRASEALGLLAMEYSTLDEKVLLVDADLTNQGLTREYNALGKAGLCDVLAESSDAMDVAYATATPGVHFVPCGDDVHGISRQADLCFESGLIQALRTWETVYDRILINAPPGESTLLEILGRNAEATVLLIHDDGVEPVTIRETADKLRRATTGVIGCLLTDFPACSIPPTSRASSA